MKKSYLLLITVLIFASCEKEEISTENEEVFSEVNLLNLETKYSSRKSSQEFSHLLYNLGVSELNVERKKDNLKLTAVSPKPFNYRGKKNYLSDYSIKLSQEHLILEQDSRYKVSISDQEIIYVETPEYKGIIQKASLDVLQDVKLFILLSYLNEVMDNSDFNSKLHYKNSCSFWDTVYSIGVGLTPTGAQADLQDSMEQDVSGGEVEGCTKMGEAEAVPFTGGTVYAQAWCCA